MARSDFYERLLQTTGHSELLSALAGSLLADMEPEGGDLKGAERDIAGFYRRLMREIRDKSPYADVGDLLLLERELRSFRNYIKRNYLDVPVSEPASEFSDEVRDALWNGQAAEVPEVFRFVAERTRQYGGDDADVAAFDAAFDSAMLAALRDAAAGTGNSFISGYWDRFDTVKGVEFLWRAWALDMPDALRATLIGERVERAFLHELNERPFEEWTEALNAQLPGLGLGLQERDRQNSVQHLRSFVSAADRWLMEYARAAKLIAFGPERIFGALLGLQSEAYNMRVAIVGRANGISGELLGKHLRAGYV